MELSGLLHKLENLHQLSLEQYQVADQLLHQLFELPDDDHFLTMVRIDDEIHLQALNTQMAVSKRFIDTEQGQWRTWVNFQSPTSSHTTCFYCNEAGHIFQERHDTQPSTSTEHPKHLESLMDLLLDNLEPVGE